MTNFQDVVEYRGSGILFSTRKGLRKEVTQRLGRFESILSRISFPRASSHLYRPRNFSPLWNISEATKNDRALLNPAYLFRYFYNESNKLFDVGTVNVKQLYLSTSAHFFLVFLLMRYVVNSLSCLCRSLPLSSFLFLLFNSLSLRFSSRVSRIRSLWHSSLSK